MSLILVLVLSLQAAAVATPAAAAPPPVAPAAHWAAGSGGLPDFDLARYRSASAGSCGSLAGADVLVCGPRHGRGDYPLEYWDRIFGPAPPLRAEMGLGGGAVGDIHAERPASAYDNGTSFDRGAVANRVMVGIRMPF